MGFKAVFLFACVISAAVAQNYRVCLSSPVTPAVCQSLGRQDSQVSCTLLESRLDCALQLARSEVDIAYFSEEETMLLTQVQPDTTRVVASVRDAINNGPYNFETVAIVPANHTNGLEGLRGGIYCHPGLDETDVKWSPRVLKTLEQLAARTDRCPNTETAGKTAEELEVETLNSFFSAACRPGYWSSNVTVDADLKSRFPNLCSLCGPDSGCSKYTIDMGVTIANVNNDNRHIQSLECLRSNANESNAAVAYVAWQHTKTYFNIRNPQVQSSFAVLCPNGTLVPLTNAVLTADTAPCAFVRQPWATIVATTATADRFLNDLRTWWPAGRNPSDNTWRTTLYNVLAGGTFSRVEFQDAPNPILNYTSPIRNISSIDSTASCLPARRWCTTSAQEQTKCSWVRAAAYTLGIEPTLGCQQRETVLACLAEVKDNKADFISIPSNYGYLARQHYNLAPVKLVENDNRDASGIAAFVKESAVAADNITRFENLRGKVACFPEFGGLAYVSFVRAGHERGILSSSECDYAKTVGEFFSGACAPGAIDAAHALSDSSFFKIQEEIIKLGSHKERSYVVNSTFDSSVLCSACKPAVTPATNESQSICTWDYSNKYFGNNGSLSCLSDPNTDVAFLDMRSVATHLSALNLQANQFRALCRNNSLAAFSGINNIDTGCLLAHVVDAEVVTRRNDPLFNSLNTLFDSLDDYFGYTAASGNQLINLEIYSAFDGTNGLLFKNSTIGLTEPTINSKHEIARNYIELFQHLSDCTGNAAAPGPGPGNVATRTLYSIISIITMTLLTRFVVY